MYLNVNVNEVWVVEDEPILLSGVDISFGLGNEVGTMVQYIDYGIELTSGISNAMPVVTYTGVAVGQEVVAFNSGLKEDLPNPGGGEITVGGQAVSPETFVNIGIENPEQELAECMPHGLRNSLKWMNTKHSLGIPDTLLGLQDVKTAIDFDAYMAAPVSDERTDKKGTAKNQLWWEHKRDVYNKWVVTEKIEPDGNVDRIGKLLKADCDIEMVSTGHLSVVVGWTKLENGEYKIDVSDDSAQGKPGGNEKPHRTTWGGKTNNALTKTGYVRGKVKYFICECPRKKGGIKGDPHIMTWSGQLFDFQGECDLVFIHAPGFGAGRGLGMNESLVLDLHVRTKIRYAYSYIQVAALRIGDDVLEVAGWGDYKVNGVFAGGLEERGGLAGLFPIFHTQVSKKHHIFDVVVDPAVNITFSTFKDIVSVEIKGGSLDDFEDSVGLMGSFVDGAMFARDGHTIIADATAFGQEWQVQKHEPMLFQTIRAPQHPQDKCRLPSSDTMQTLRRRLGESSLSKREAEEACAHLTGAGKSACVVDVVAFGDPEIAQAGTY